MNIVVGINHPKQVYIFKNLIIRLNKKDHKVLILLVDKEVSEELLKSLEISYFKIGQNKKNIFKKAFDLIPLTAKSLAKLYNFKPDIFVGQAIPHIAFTSMLYKKPYLIFEDTEHAKYPHLLANPFASHIITPNFFEKDFGSKQIKVQGSFEYAYLNKSWFNPDIEILDKYGISKDETFSIARFVNWAATHDIGHKGITISNKIKAVNKFAEFGKVLISSEAVLPEELDKHKINIDPIDMHSLIYYAKLVYGESASMAAEAGYLGTPSIFLDNDGRGYTNQLAKYDLVYNFSESLEDQERSILKGIKILSSENKKYWQEQSIKLNNDCIDIGSFMIWFVENYPESGSIMSENIDYQYRFK